jgi:hypothetical protein
MRVIRKFQTADGKEFLDELAAKKHEVEIDSLNQLRNLLNLSINSNQVRPGNIDNVLKQILVETPNLINILRSYQRKQPRKKEPELDFSIKITA